MFPLLAILLLAQNAQPSDFSRSDEPDSSRHETHAPETDTSNVVLRFAGDCVLAGHYEADVGDSSYQAFKGFEVLRSADVSMVNLECPITTRGRPVMKPFNFRMHPRFLPALVTAGVDVVNLANNHIYDFGEVGLFDTISYLDSVAIRHVGAGRNAQEARRPVVLDVKGRHIAILGYYGGGEAPKATSSHPGVADRQRGNIISDIAAVRRRDSLACIVVNLHWGTEKDDVPERSQIDFAHDVVDAGADVIIGHHSHVLQGIERYKSGVIVYSLGNFIFGGNSRDTYDTALFEVRLNGGSSEYSLLPVRIDRWQARTLSGEEAEHVLQVVKKLSKVFHESIFMNKEER